MNLDRLWFSVFGRSSQWPYLCGHGTAQASSLQWLEHPDFVPPSGFYFPFIPALQLLDFQANHFGCGMLWNHCEQLHKIGKTAQRKKRHSYNHHWHVVAWPHWEWLAHFVDGKILSVNWLFGEKNPYRFMVINLTYKRTIWCHYLLILLSLTLQSLFLLSWLFSSLWVVFSYFFAYLVISEWIPNIVIFCCWLPEFLVFLEIWISDFLEHN